MVDESVRSKLRRHGASQSRTPCQPHPSPSATASILAPSPAPTLRDPLVLASRFRHRLRPRPRPSRAFSLPAVRLLCVVSLEGRLRRQHWLAFRAPSSTYSSENREGLFAKAGEILANTSRCTPRFDSIWRGKRCATRDTVTRETASTFIST